MIRLILRTSKVVLIRMNLGRSVWVRSVNCDTYGPLLTICIQQILDLG